MNKNFMRLLGIVARRDYLRSVRRRGFIFGTLLLPIGIAALFGISILASGGSNGPSGPSGNAEITVVNQSSVALPTGLPNVHVVDLETAQEQLASGEIEEYAIIPATWPGDPNVTVVVDATRGGGLSSITRQANQEALLDSVLVASVLRNANIPADVATRLLNPATVVTIDQEGNPYQSSAAVASFLVPYAFTLLFVMSIFITSGYLLQSVTEEKENRVVEIVLSSVPPLPLMAGKVLGLGAAGLTQVVIWVGTALLTLPLINQQFSVNVQIPPLTLGLAVLYFALGYLAYGAIFAAIGAIAPGTREAQQYSGFLGFFAVIPLILSSVFLTDLSSPIVWVLTLFPLTTPATMLQVLVLSPTVPWFQVIVSLVVLVVFVGLATVGSARVFRATVLLYGVRPSMKRIMGAMLAKG
jgi:ABC-2 type transport system permease protein